MKVEPNLKDTSIHWIGEIPDNWNLGRVKNLTYVKARIGWQGMRSDEFIDSTDWFCVTGTDFKDGAIDWSNCYCIEEWRFDQDKKIQLQLDDILITKDGTIGKVALIDSLPKKTTLNSGVFVTRPYLNAYNIKYFYWVLNSNVFKEFIDYFKNGSTILHLYQNVFERFIFPIPTKSHQPLIANYLDVKTELIDKKANLLKNKIVYYKELRKSIINETVTKGLDKSVKLKESGIDWIGQIPEHWEVKRLKDVDLVIMGQSPKSDDYNFEFKGFPFLQGNAEFGPLHPNPSVWCEVANKVIEINDILLSVRAPIGAVNIANRKYGIGRGLCAIRAKKSNNKFLYYNFIARNADLNSIGTGTTYIAISLRDVINLSLAFPPSTEQGKIANYLDQKTQTIDKIVSNIQSQITTLKELRKTLINDVVTGKIIVVE